MHLLAKFLGEGSCNYQMKEKPRKLVSASVELKNLRNRRPLSISLSMNALATEFSTVFCEPGKNQDIQFHLKIF